MYRPFHLFQYLIYVSVSIVLTQNCFLLLFAHKHVNKLCNLFCSFCIISKEKKSRLHVIHFLFLNFTFFYPDEYTRITTPRQDVLFKKGYLSRINNKPACSLPASTNSNEMVAASSTITTSDPDSSVSTLSPATTPSIDFGQMDSLEYAPMCYPGYYDDNGMLVIRK